MLNNQRESEVRQAKMRVTVDKNKKVQLYQLISMDEANFNTVKYQLASEGLECAFEDPDWKYQVELSLIHTDVKWLK